jgi:DNA mismatch endonuclease (patch repair protein)
MDIWSKQKRSEVMSKIRGKNTKPEKLIRSALFNKGFRFRVHRPDLPGKPDITLVKYNTVLLVHGCFWHYHPNCREGRIPDTNSSFWKNKLSKNVERDKINVQKLLHLGWNVITLWECELHQGKLDSTMKKLFKLLKHNVNAKGTFNQFG